MHTLAPMRAYADTHAIVAAGCTSVFFTLLSPSGIYFYVAIDYFEGSIQ